ncbi:MAG: nuclear transport factor 2 family protein [Actinomycetota bacterium]
MHDEVTPRAVIERYCAAWTSGDLAGLLDCYAEGFTLHYFGSSRFAGDHVGRDAAIAVLAEVSTIAPRELVAVDEVLVGDRAAAIVVRERLTRDGESHELRRLLRYRIDGERLDECWLYDEDQALVDRLWA